MALTEKKKAFAQAKMNGANNKEAAILAGCPFIHAAYGFGAAQHPAAVINTPLELIKVLELDK